MVYKPTDGWGGVGLTKIENEANLDMLNAIFKSDGSSLFLC